MPILSTMLFKLFWEFVKVYHLLIPCFLCLQSLSLGLACALYPRLRKLPRGRLVPPLPQAPAGQACILIHKFSFQFNRLRRCHNIQFLHFLLLRGEERIHGRYNKQCKYQREQDSTYNYNTQRNATGRCSTQ